MGLTYREEKFTEIWREIAALVPEHYAEVGIFKEKYPIDPDWDRFLALDRSGCIAVIAARDGGELVGYIVFILTPAMHFRTKLFAHDDAFFLRKSHRKGLAGLRLFKEAEKVLRAKGVSRVTYHEKSHVPVRPLFQRLGYDEIERMWSKVLE